MEAVNVEEVVEDTVEPVMPPAAELTATVVSLDSKVPWKISVRWQAKGGLAGVYSPSHEIEKRNCRMFRDRWPRADTYVIHKSAKTRPAGTSNR